MVRGLQAVASGSNPVLTSGLHLFPVAQSMVSANQCLIPRKPIGFETT